MKTPIVLAFFFLLTLGPARVSLAETGILLLAHGGQAGWNARVDSYRNLILEREA